MALEQCFDKARMKSPSEISIAKLFRVSVGATRHQVTGFSSAAMVPSSLASIPFLYCCRKCWEVYVHHTLKSEHALSNDCFVLNSPYDVHRRKIRRKVNSLKVISCSGWLGVFCLIPSSPVLK